MSFRPESNRAWLLRQASRAKVNFHKRRRLLIKKTELQKRLQRALWKMADFSAYALLPVHALCNLLWRSSVTRVVSEILQLKSSICGSSCLKQDELVSVLSRNGIDSIFQTEVLSPRLASAQWGRRMSPFSCLSVEYCRTQSCSKLFVPLVSLLQLIKNHKPALSPVSPAREV